MKFKFPFSRFIVSDRSMEPYLHSGEHVLTFNWITPRKGDVIVYLNGKYFVKRVKEIKSDRVIVEAENKVLAKKLYVIKPSDIVGRVFLKY